MSLFKRNRPDPRSSERAAALASWASGHGWQYVDTFPPTRSVLLARGERNEIYDLVAGPLVAGLDCQLFTFDWITSMTDSYGGGSYKHQPSLSLRAAVPSPPAGRSPSGGPAPQGAPGARRGKPFGTQPP